MLIVHILRIGMLSSFNGIFYLKLASLDIKCIKNTDIIMIYQRLEK